MKIEPNKDIGMEAVNVLVHNGVVELESGAQVSKSALSNGNNAFIQLCQEIDPNITYVNVLIPDHSDDDLYFNLVEQGESQGVHVQSITRRTKEIWDIWNVLKNTSSE